MFESLITKNMILASPWREAVANSDRKECTSYCTEFNKKISEIGEGSEFSEPLRLLSAICSMYFADRKNTREPFGPMMQTGERRTFLPQDLSDEQADELYKFIEHIDSSELRARIADTIWISRKGITLNRLEVAKIAILSYIESCEHHIKSKHPIIGIERLERAVSLAAGLGKGGDKELKQALRSCKRSLLRLTNSEINACQYRLIKLLHKRNYGSKESLGAMCYDFSERMESQKGNWDLIRSYWELAAKIFISCDSNIIAKSIRYKGARTYIKQVSESESNMLKSIFLSSAIEAFRRLGEYGKIVEILHKWLIRIEALVPEEMQCISSGPIDLSDCAHECRKKVSGKSYRDALVAFALITHPCDYESSRKQAIEETKKFVLSSLFGGQQLNKKGKVVAVTPPAYQDDQEQYEISLLHKMHRNFDLNCKIKVVGAIEPARHKLNEEHRLTEEEIFPLVSNCPFVPEDREMIFAKGIAAGFEGDFLVAEHLLIPQIENSLRCVIEQRGGITSTINNGIQRERMLNDILDDRLILQTFGQSTVFALKTLLVEQTGSNHRHELCHGLLGYSDFFSYTSVFIWWMTFRMCCLPLIHEWIKKQQLIVKLITTLNMIIDTKSSDIDHSLQ